MPARDDFFTGKVAVVTGAGSGIGRSIAQLLARSGAKVHCADINGEAAAAVATELLNARSHALDVTDPEGVATLAEAVYAEDGRVDLLFNNAGIGHAARIGETTLDDWRAVLAVNLMGVVHGIDAFLPRMLAQSTVSRVVNTASGAGLFPHPRMAPYTASKHAVVGLSTSLAAELHGSSVGFTILCPGIIKTNITQGERMRGADEASREAAQAYYEKNGVSPDQVARDVLHAVRKSKLFCLSPSGQVGVGWWIYRLWPALAMRVMRAQIAKVQGNE